MCLYVHVCVYMYVHVRVNYWLGVFNLRLYLGMFILAKSKCEWDYVV